MRDSSATWARISRAPSAQLRPTDTGFTCASEFQNASGVWPDSVRPERSVIVPESMTGSSTPDLRERVAGAGVGGLGVQRVEDRLDEQQVRAAFDEAERRLAIGVAQLIERDRAKAGIAHVGRDRRRAVGGAERAGDEAAAAVLLLRHVAGLARKPRAVAVERVHVGLAAVIGLRDRGGGERVRLADVGAREKVGEMNVADRLGLREDEDVVVALEVVAVVGEHRSAKARFIELQVLDHRAHRAVEHEDALCGGGGKGARGCLLRCGSCQAAFCEGCARRPSRWQMANTRSALFIV